MRTVIAAALVVAGLALAAPTHADDGEMMLGAGSSTCGAFDEFSPVDKVQVDQWVLGPVGYVERTAN